MDINELNKLRTKYYLLEEGGQVYCSKCGKKVLKDTYQYSQHQDKCKIKFVDKYKPSKNNQIYGFSFRIIDNKLVFNVYQLGLELIGGFTDRYSGSKRKTVFKATFEKESRNVTEKGLYNIDVWFKKMIDMDGIVCLNKYDYIKVINEYYSSVKEIYNLGMFLDLYRQKGYKESSINLEDILSIREKKHFDDISLLKDKKILNNSFFRSSSYSYLEKKYYCICDSFNINDDIVVECSLYKVNELYDLFINSVDFKSSEKALPYKVIYLSKDYIETKDGEIIYDELMKNIIGFKYNNIDLFIDKYPELMISNYFNNGGKNIFNIVLSSNYNKCIEMTAKAGLSYIADHFYLLEDIINIHANNISEIFGIPLKILRSLDNNDGVEFLLEDGFIDACKKAQALQPATFEKPLNKTQNQFIIDYFNTTIFSGFNNKDFLKTIRYLDNENYVNNNMGYYYYYKDYINMCNKYKEFISSKWPKDVIVAHDNIDELIRINADRITAECFKNAVEEYHYARLASGYIEKDDKEPVINSEVYEIIVPKHHTDLINESNKLGHCVKTYIDKVSNKQTYILFLRKKESPDTPLATIEVLTNYTLIQLKAKYNSRAEKSAQNFVKKWAKAKGIKISSYDFD